MYHMWSAERLEKKAAVILKEYKNGELLDAPKAMDVDHFAEYHLKTKIDFVNLSCDGQILGCTCFSDGHILVWNDERSEQIPLDVQKGYILIDNAMLDTDVEGRTRFTIIHECAHWILHQRFYYQKSGEMVIPIQCNIYQIEDTEKRLPKTDEEIREWQANRLGAALIMPSSTVKMLLASLTNTKPENLTTDYYSSVLIDKMAAVYNVSQTAMSIRLKELNLLHQD